MHTSPCSRFEFATPVVINTDCIGSCKSNYHTITAMMALPFKYIDIKTKMSIKYNKQGNVLRVMIFKQQIYLASWQSVDYDHSLTLLLYCLCLCVYVFRFVIVCGLCEWKRANVCRFIIVCLYIYYCWRSNYQEWRVWIPFHSV